MLLRVLILVLAIGAAGSAAWLTLRVTAEEAPIVMTAEPQPISTVEILVAMDDIAGGAVLSPDKLRWESWPEDKVNEQYIARQARPDAVAELSGAFVNGGFVAGEPIRQARLAQVNANLLSAKLEPGKRGVAVKVTAESAAGGFILPGDRVDVIHTATVPGRDGAPPRNESRLLLANIRVMAIDQTAVQSPEGSVLGKTATLEVTPLQAEQVMAAEASGQLSLALRAVADHAEVIEYVEPEPDPDPEPVAEAVAAPEPAAEPERARSVRVNRAAQTTIVTFE